MLLLPTGLAWAWRHRHQSSGRWELGLLIGSAALVLPLRTQLPWYSHPLWLPFALVSAPLLNWLVERTDQQVPLRRLLLRIPAMWMRGGTSKALYLLQTDISSDAAIRDRLLLRIMGSPDRRQIDGLGGADPLTSKIAIISASDDPEAAEGSRRTLRVKELVQNTAGSSAERPACAGLRPGAAVPAADGREGGDQVPARGARRRGRRRCPAATARSSARARASATARATWSENCRQTPCCRRACRRRGSSPTVLLMYHLHVSRRRRLSPSDTRRTSFPAATRASTS